jgi:hypothetical protein
VGQRLRRGWRPACNRCLGQSMTNPQLRPGDALRGLLPSPRELTGWPLAT